MSVEDKFFPLIAGELGNSTESAEKYQKKLDEFTPTVKVVFLTEVAVAAGFSFLFLSSSFSFFPLQPVLWSVAVKLDLLSKIGNRFYYILRPKLSMSTNG